MKKLIIYFLMLILILVLSGCTTQTYQSSPPKKEPVEEGKAKNSPNPDKKKTMQGTPPVKQTDESNLITSNGPLEHIFFHPLIAYPQLAFDGDRKSKGYDEYFVTVNEFNKMIQSIYEKNYILVKMSDIFEEKEINGKISLVKKELKLPKDKKPLILSVDDMNYYSYMIENGNVYKLIIDSKGKIATYSKDQSGKEVISEENEIVPLLNHFVEEHPDFSFHGAKGILALTGYEGVLGYRTNMLNSTNYPYEKEEALKIINKLKLDGWEFASHGYGHLNTQAISLQIFINDTTQWMNEVSPLIGKTDIYIYPFGSSVLPNDAKFQYLESQGFKIFCSVGPNPYLKYTEDYAMMDRVHIDGIGLETQPQIMQRFFDSKGVIDQARFSYH
jgi:hypothetical protein